MRTPEPELVVRVALPDDLTVVTETVSLAFHDDPTWSWAFPTASLRQEQYTALWGLMVGAALREPWVFMTARCEAVAVWIPPGAAELSDAEGRQLEAMIESFAGERTSEVLALFALFEGARPLEPHYYLSLLATHPAHAGNGLGLALLAENLRRIDAEGVCAYLESSNPANNRRYERHGFEATGSFTPPGSDIPVTTMWRRARS